MRPHAILLLACLMSGVATCSNAEPLGDIKACAARLAAADAFSGTVAVTRDGRVVWRGAYGARDAGGPAITPDTAFNVGSMGKMFTAVAIGQMVDAGKLRFEDRVGKFLPDLPADVAAVTIGQLLSHTSGLGDYLRLENRPVIQAANSAADLLGIAVAGGLRFPAGSRHAYSNSGFVVLGAVIERLSGRTYADYVREHIFVPAGMRATTFAAPPAAATALTRMMNDDPAQPRRPAPIIGGGRGGPAGGEYSTVDDLLGFAMALTNNRLTSAATARALTALRVPEPHPANPDLAGDSYGFDIYDLGGHGMFGHGGGAPGVNGELVMAPGDRWALAVLANEDPPAASEIAVYARRAMAHPGSLAPDRCGGLAPRPQGGIRLAPGPG